MHTAHAHDVALAHQHATVSRTKEPAETEGSARALALTGESQKQNEPQATHYMHAKRRVASRTSNTANQARRRAPVLVPSEALARGQHSAMPF